MPIQMRLGGGRYNRIFNGIMRVVNGAEQFIVFGTYSVNVNSSIMQQIIEKKQSNPNLFVCAFIPPPTDFVIWNFSLRRAFAHAYGFPSDIQEDLNEAIANDPIPAFNILEGQWQNAQQTGGSRRGYGQIRRYIKQIFDLWGKGINVLLEPNTHAKFALTDKEIYEGSGNLTYYGLRINVEVYNFIERSRFPGAYNYCFQSYTEFLVDYLMRFVDWKDGSNYIRNASSLGQTISQIISQLQVRFNPSVNQDKIDRIWDARIEISNLRSTIWMLPGIKETFKKDLLLALVTQYLGDVSSQLYQFRDEKEVEKDDMQSQLSQVNKKLETSIYALKNLQQIISKEALEIEQYEIDQNKRSIKEFSNFFLLLKKEMDKDETA